MRVLFIHAALSGLSAEYSVHASLAASASAIGVESSFIWQPPIDRSLLVGAGLEDVTLHDFGRDGSITPRPSKSGRARLMATRLPASVAAVRSTVERVQPDLVYSSQQQLDVGIARLCSRWFEIPHVVHVHCSLGPWAGRAALRLIKHTPHVIAVSEFVRQAAMLEGVQPENITTILNPLPFTHADPDVVDREDVRASLGIPSTAPVVVAAGRLSPGKGHAPMLEAFKLVLDRLPEARLLICGSAGSEAFGNELMRLAGDLGVQRSTIFAGWRGDMPRVYRAADVFCLPAELEGFGLVHLEAMAAGLPVVAAYSGGTPELVVHERTGLLSYPNDTEALAADLTKLLSDPALARELGNAGRQRAHTVFDSTTVARQWANYLAEIVTPKSAVRAGAGMDADAPAA